MRRVYAGVVLMLCWHGWLAAAEVGPLTVFTPGTPAKAAEVNGNFDAIKNAVNQNYQQQQETAAAVDGLDNRVDAVERTKQARVAGRCENDTAITEIAEDGSVLCSTAPTSGYVVVGAPEFDLSADYALGCGIVRNPHYGYFAGPEAGPSFCMAHATVRLPDGVKLADLQCRIHDDDGWAAIGFALFRFDLFGFDPAQEIPTEQIFNTGNSSVDSLEVQTLVNSIAVNDGVTVVDNSNFVYVLRLVATNEYARTFSELGHHLGFYGCRIAYTR